MGEYLCRGWLGKDAALGRAVLALADDPAVTVRYQVALSLGEWDDAGAGRALGRLASKDGSDPWVRAAVVSSSTRHAAAVLEAVVTAADDGGPSPALVEPLIATLSGAQSRPEIARALAAIGRTPPRDAKGWSWRIGATAQLLDSVRDGSLASEPVVQAMFSAARRIAADASSPAAERASALRLLGRARGPAADLDLIAGRLEPGEPAAVQLSAVRALSRMEDERADGSIVAHLSRLAPSARAEAFDVLLSRPSSAAVLLSALEAGKVAPGEVDAAHRQRMLAVPGEPFHGRAAGVFRSPAAGPRRDVLKTYANVTAGAGDADRGKAVFSRVCAACHKLGGQGHEVGPDLSALTDRSPGAMLTAIFDPNRDVDARYSSYTVALKDGRVLTGLVASETANAVNLKQPDGRSEVVLRADLEELSTAGRSLMPEGLENDLKPAELADLLAFLAGGAVRPKAVEGNRPRTVAQGDDGSVRLPATAAEVYGPSLTYEAPQRNLGLWQSDDDRAAWSFRLDRPGTFTVSMEWACADESAGNPYVVRVGGTTLR
ncbi:MAG: c-type cytochrome, partial [Planctomycetia bacterium]|nr:c-type cytochrome [Planctomycetia bacterium]